MLTLDRTCQLCGAAFYQRPAVVRRVGGRYCSRKCARQAQPTVPLNERFWAKVNQTSGCWEWTGSRNPKGYGQIQRGGRGGGLVLTHRLSWEIHNGSIPDSLFVLHKCDNPACVRPDHLWIGSKAENTADMMAKGRHKTAPPKRLLRGEDHPNARLTNDIVSAIRERCASGELSQSEAGRVYGLTSGSVNRIVKRLRWKHL